MELTLFKNLLKEKIGCRIENVTLVVDSLDPMKTWVDIEKEIYGYEEVTYYRVFGYNSKENKLIDLENYIGHIREDYRNTPEKRIIKKGVPLLQIPCSENYNYIIVHELIRATYLDNVVTPSVNKTEQVFVYKNNLINDFNEKLDKEFEERWNKWINSQF